MKLKPWNGKHMWIWMLNQTGPPVQIVSRSVDMGLSGLLVKAWDGGSSGLFLEQLMQIIKPAHDAGLFVGAWGYSYGNNIAGEVKAMEKASKAGADWLVIDAEDEYENHEGKNKALKLGIEVTRALGTSVYLGYSTFALPQYHDAFPYQEFSSYCSVCLPQVYWGLMSLSSEEALAMSLRGLEEFRLPVVPVGQSYGEVTPDEIIRFSRIAMANSLEGISYYNWQHATEAQLDAVSRAAYGKDDGGWGRMPAERNAEGQPEPTKRKRKWFRGRFKPQ
ncbi:MAG: hypothetical protein ACOX4K_09980 [Bacillota bacterium]